MKKLKYALALVAITTATSSYAAKLPTNYYFGVGLSAQTYKIYDPSGGLNGNVNGLYAIAGLPLNRYVDIEARYGLGITKDSYSVNTHQVNVELDHYYGAYAKAKLPMMDLFTPYAIVGYTRSSINANISSSRSLSRTDSGVSYGAGVEIHVLPIDINLEYVNYLDTNKYTLSSINLSFTKTF